MSSCVAGFSAGYFARSKSISCWVYASMCENFFAFSCSNGSRDDNDDTEETSCSSDPLLPLLRLILEELSAAGSNNGEPDAGLL